MTTPWIPLLAILLLCVSQLGAQVITTARNVTVQISDAQAWTDSGLDLQSGDLLEISGSSLSNRKMGQACPRVIRRV